MVAYAKHLSTTDERNAFVWYRAAAERGDSRAWAELGQLLASGTYFEPNAVDAARCWKRAAQMGDNKGKCCLGLCYIRGYGVRQDPSRGLEIVRQVADVHNDVTAMRNLAWIYRKGADVPKNSKEAEYWQNRANTQHEKMMKLSSREHVLFGRTKSSRSKFNNVDHQPNTNPKPPVPLHTAKQHIPSAEPAPDSPYQTSDVYVRDNQSKTTQLHEDDVEARLNSVTPTHVPNSQSLRAKSIAATHTVTAIADPRSIQTEQTDVIQTTREELVQSGAPAVLQTSAVLDGDSTADIPFPATAAQKTNFYSDLDTIKKQPDPDLGREVAGLNFVERSGTIHSESIPADALGISEEEFRAVHETATLKAARQEELFSADTPAPQQVSVTNVEEPILSAQRTSSPSHESLDDNFVTPEESLDGRTSEPERVTSAVTVGLVGAGAGATTAALLSSREDNYALDARDSAVVGAVQERRESYEDQELHGREEVTSSLTRHNDVFDGDDYEEEADPDYEEEDPDYEEEEEVESELEDDDEPELDDEEEEHFEEARPFVSSSVAGPVAGASAVAGAGGIAVATAASSAASSGREVESKTESVGVHSSQQDSDTLAPSVKSRTMYFETQAAKEEVERYEGVRQTPSYSLNGAKSGLVQQRSVDIEEFENNDVVQASEALAASRLGASSGQNYTASQSMSYPMTRTTEQGSEGQVVRSRAFGFENQTVSTSELEKILESYPENPMRGNSRISLYQFLIAVQGFAVTSPEAFTVLQKGNGLPKVVVAMISQPEDHAIQEQGLHAFVRMMRATQGPPRERLVAMTFGDCYRKVKDDPDVVVPKGTMGVDEDISGAIQAITLAMRTHSEIRRVQLSGCAALAEVASVSSNCRKVAFENGAVSLVLGCLRHRSTKAAATIHDVGARTVSAFCAGKESFTFKEAFTNAGAVPELLNILRMWGHSEDERSELTTTVVKSTCVALRYITDCCAVASTQCVQSYAYHHLVRVMVLYRKDVSVCTIVVSTLSTVTRNAGTFAEKGLLDAKPLREVLVTMQTHSDNPLFIRKSLDFMDALANFSSMREELVEEGSIPFAADIIAQNSGDSLLLERACSVVEKLCRGNPGNQDIFGKHSGVRSLNTLLKSQQGLPGVTERDLMATASVCTSNKGNQQEALKCGAPEAITLALNAYNAKNARVVAAAACAMASIVTPKNSPAAQKFTDVKAPDYVVRAMKKHPDSVLVQENGSTAVAAFCESDPRIINILLKSGISSILVVALQRFLHKQSAVVQIARAMRAITNEANPEGSYRFKTKLLTDRSNESSLPEIFHTALLFHTKGLPESANVIISICATINRLCMRSVTFKNEIGKDGIVEELKRLVEQTSGYREINALQPVLATICTLVLDSEDNKNRFHEVGGVEAILKVMQSWRDDTYVLEHCCAALRYSCNDHYGNCIEVKNHNGVRSITGVMEKHSQNVNVMMWCCLTLADLCKGDEDVQSSRLIIEGIRRVISAMTTFADNHRFLAGACEFLRAASLDHEANQERIVRLGGRTAIVRALESHPGNSTLTEAGSYALIQIQDVVESRSADGSGRLSIVQRFSREMRRSSSAKSKDSGKGGLMSRKSFSFSRRRSAKQQQLEEDTQALHETVAVENPATKPGPIGFSRGSRRRRRRGKQEIEELPDEADAQEAVEEGYDEPSAPANDDDSPNLD